MIVDTDTGELQNDRFAKMMTQDISRLFDLTKTEMNVLLLMVKTVSGKVTGFNRVLMNTKKRREYAEELGMKNYKTISNSLQRLAKKGIISREGEGSVAYILDPDLFFVGNEYQQANLMISYSKDGRKLKVFNSRDEIRNWLDDEDKNDMNSSKS